MFCICCTLHFTLFTSPLPPTLAVFSVPCERYATMLCFCSTLHCTFSTYLPPPPPTSLAVFFLPIFSVAPSPPSENFDQATVSLNYSVQEGESLFLPIKVPIWLVHTREILNKNNKCRHTMEYSSFSDLNNSDKVLYLLIRLFLLKKT